MKITRFKQIEINEWGSLRLTVLFVEGLPNGEETTRPHQLVFEPLEETFDDTLAMFNVSLERDHGYPPVPDDVAAYARASRVFAHEQPMIAERLAWLRADSERRKAENTAEVERETAAKAEAEKTEAERIRAAARQLLVEHGLIKPTA